MPFLHMSNKNYQQVWSRVVLMIVIAVHAASVTACRPASERDAVSSGQNRRMQPQAGSPAYAKRFSIVDKKGYRTLLVMSGQGSSLDTLRYLLLPHGSPIPSGFNGYSVIRTPVRRAAVFSTTQIGFIDLLGESDRIVGISRSEFVNTPSLRRRIADGSIAEIGMPFSPDLETILALDPGVVFAPALPPSRKSGYQTLEHSSIPVLVIAEWQEETPLGRAEWLKLFGVLFGREELAHRRFAEIEASYRSIREMTGGIRNRPVVLCGLPVKDSWFVPAGESYVAALLSDAGASYPWAGEPGSGSVELDIEAVYPLALQADYWLNPGIVKSLEELIAIDARFADLGPVKNGRVYNNNRQLNEYGGNAYWEYGVVRPDAILRDLVMILHPGLLRANGLEESFTFYREVK